MLRGNINESRNENLANNSSLFYDLWNLSINIMVFKISITKNNIDTGKINIDTTRIDFLV